MNNKKTWVNPKIESVNTKYSEQGTKSIAASPEQVIPVMVGTMTTLPFPANS